MIWCRRDVGFFGKIFLFVIGLSVTPGQRQAALRPGGILSQTAGTDCDGYPSALRLTLAALLLTSAAAPQRVAGASAAAAAEERSVFVSASANPFWASLGHGHGESNDVRRDG